MSVHSAFVRTVSICMLAVAVHWPVTAHADDTRELTRIIEIVTLADTDNQTAIQQLEALRSAQNDKTSKRVKLETIRALSGLYYDAGKVQVSDDMLRELQQLAAEIGDENALMIADIMRSGQMMEAGQNAQALQLLKNLEGKLSARAEPDVRFRLSSALGFAYYQTGNFEAAQRYYLDALKKTDDLVFRRIQRRIYALDALAKLYANMRDPEKALTTIREALELSPLARAPKIYSSLSMSEGFALSQLGRHDEAMQAYQRTLKMAREYAMPLVELLCLANIGDYYLTKQDYKLAERYSRDALQMAESLGDKASAAVARVNIGLALGGQGKVQQGGEMIETVLKPMIEAEQIVDAEAILGELAGMYERNGWFKEALITVRQQQKLSEQLFRSDRAKAVAAMQEQFQAEQRQKKIELLARENDLKDAELNNRRLQQIVMALGGVIAVMAGFFVYLLYRRVQRVNQKLVEVNSQLEFHAVRDPLTGLFNRRSFVDLMKKRTQQTETERREARIEYPDGLILMDIDHFKQINDILGHAAGDAVLIEVARRLRETVRESDMVLRWGGEEFLIFTPHAAPDQIAVLVERVLNAIGETQIQAGDRKIQVTVTAGFISLPFAGLDESVCGWEKALQIADMALYLGKANGRNRAYGIAGLKTRSEAMIQVLEQDLAAAIKTGMVDMAEVHGPARFEATGFAQFEPH
ncbi:tetratricopeptide repeat-containing diguanylate cyclase [Undibacterium squillarum]|uniref:diguanylate cyclase n=1 Tax=Undibacterium squillarum TaxID=1131567 RepID=A0ABQ2XZS5_9BURK|nr:GGDEF domain-containing protein [Undibacterium squillarum]GGX45372.1 hypothetical protein GCM10010946_24720 [Undibacterium squillarum]